MNNNDEMAMALGECTVKRGSERARLAPTAVSIIESTWKKARWVVRNKEAEK